MNHIEGIKEMVRCLQQENTYLKGRIVELKSWLQTIKNCELCKHYNSQRCFECSPDLSDWEPNIKEHKEGEL